MGSNPTRRNFVDRQVLKAEKRIKPNYIGTLRRDTSQSGGRSVRYSEIGLCDPIWMRVIETARSTKFLKYMMHKIYFNKSFFSTFVLYKTKRVTWIFKKNISVLAVIAVVNEFMSLMSDFLRVCKKAGRNAKLLFKLVSSYMRGPWYCIV